MRVIVAAMAVGLLGSVAMGQLNQGKGSFEVLGLGGAGGMYTPVVSPHDAKLMFVTCDMSGVYRSADGGKAWELIHRKQLSSARESRPAFTADAIYWATGKSLRCSKDKGVTWQEVVGADSPWQDGITNIAAIDAEPARLFVGTATGAWSSMDGGKTWKRLADGRCNGIVVVGRDFVAAAMGAADTQSLQASPDGGKTWNKLDAPGGGKQVTAIAGACQVVAGKPGPATLMATINTVGVARSADAGKTWEVVDTWKQQRDILMPAGQTKIVYASQMGSRSQEVFRTSDGGKTWASIFHMSGPGANVEKSWVQTQLKWGYYISPLGLGIDTANPDVAMVTTQGDFYRTSDGGKSWKQMMNIEVGVKDGDSGFRYRSSGLEVTSCWGYYFDPVEAGRHYICYTDIGFGRSVDKGQTWIWSAAGSPWSNTFYQIVFDPFVKGRIYAACSNRHDIPHWTHLTANTPSQTGGMCVSDDRGVTWKVLGKGLPALPCTGIVIDPKSTKDKLVMYATVFGSGVYKSVDGGKTWESKSKGLGREGNTHCYRTQIHPKSGNLYCVVTGLRKDLAFPVPGGLFKSTDGGESWKDITAEAKLAWPTDFAIDPVDEDIIFLTAGTIPRGPQGGIYQTADGGKSWKYIMKDADFAKWMAPGFVQAQMVTMHPDSSKIIYCGTASHGLWVSQDSGKTWQPFKKFPFGPVQSVAFDPADHKIMYVTTFGGGVWKGGYLPVND